MTAAHTKSCVCAECCTARGARKAADVKVMKPLRKAPDTTAAGQKIARAGGQLTVAVWVMIPLAVIAALLIASAAHL